MLHNSWQRCSNISQRSACGAEAEQSCCVWRHAVADQRILRIVVKGIQRCGNQGTFTRRLGKTWPDLRDRMWSVSEEIHSSGQVHLSWHVAKRLCQWSIHTYSHHFACANALHRDWKFCSLFSVCTSILTHCLIPNQIYCIKVCISHHVQALYNCTNQ